VELLAPFLSFTHGISYLKVEVIIRINELKSMEIREQLKRSVTREVAYTCRYYGGRVCNNFKFIQ